MLTCRVTRENIDYDVYQSFNASVKSYALFLVGPPETRTVCNTVFIFTFIYLFIQLRERDRGSYET
jgi:hypothetical protein